MRLITSLALWLALPLAALASLGCSVGDDLAGAHAPTAHGVSKADGGGGPDGGGGNMAGPAGAGGIDGAQSGAGGSGAAGGLPSGSSGSAGGAGGAGGTGGAPQGLSTPPSCQGNTPGAGHDCGLAGSDDCCAVLPVPGGTFDRMNDPAYPATVSAFRLDKYPITVGRFRAFIAAGQGTQEAPPAPGSGANPYTGGRDTGWKPAWNAHLAADEAALRSALHCDAWEWNTWTQDPGDAERKPIVCVTYYELRAFCAWDGGFLPTEAQFNHAAVGGDEQRPYPWGSDESGVPLRAAYDCMGDGSPAQQCQPSDITEVGLFPLGVGRWGHLDLSGIAYNTTLDSLDDFFPQVPCNDCVRYDEGEGTMNWSGSGVAKLFKLKNDHRAGYPKTARYYFRSGRCARAL
ncbi:formylglycine-generating enzyme family protein [Chondromyces apiculatus]|nr:SUMF1/EgtB/PvdO family nonheme iron enzyme [Chondromyces apiculatus]